MMIFHSDVKLPMVSCRCSSTNSRIWGYVLSWTDPPKQAQSIEDCPAPGSQGHCDRCQPHLFAGGQRRPLRDFRKSDGGFHRQCWDSAMLGSQDIMKSKTMWYLHNLPYSPQMAWVNPVSLYFFLAGVVGESSMSLILLAWVGPGRLLVCCAFFLGYDYGFAIWCVSKI